MRTTKEILKELKTKGWESPEQVDEYFESVLKEKDKEVERLKQAIKDVPNQPYDTGLSVKIDNWKDKTLNSITDKIPTNLIQIGEYRIGEYSENILWVENKDGEGKTADKNFLIIPLTHKFKNEF